MTKRIFFQAVLLSIIAFVILFITDYLNSWWHDLSNVRGIILLILVIVPAIFVGLIVREKNRQQLFWKLPLTEAINYIFLIALVIGVITLTEGDPERGMVLLVLIPAMIISILLSLVFAVILYFVTPRKLIIFSSIITLILGTMAFRLYLSQSCRPKQINCITNKAIKQRDPTLCEDLDLSVSAQDYCYGSVIKQL